MAEYDDVSSLDEAAISLHEMYASLVRAGFTEEQAFQLILIQWQGIVEAQG